MSTNIINNGQDTLPLSVLLGMRERESKSEQGGTESEGERIPSKFCMAIRELNVELKLTNHETIT